MNIWLPQKFGSNYTKNAVAAGASPRTPLAKFISAPWPDRIFAGIGGYWLLPGGEGKGRIRKGRVGKEKGG